MAVQDMQPCDRCGTNKSENPISFKPTAQIRISATAGAGLIPYEIPVTLCKDCQIQLKRIIGQFCFGADVPKPQSQSKGSSGIGI